MRIVRRSVTLPLTALLLLTGCGNLLGGGKRDTLLRFGMIGPVSAPSHAMPTQRHALSLGRISVPPEAEGDRILTTRGETMLYLKDARWVASVPELLAQALDRQFRNRAPHIALVPARSSGRLAPRLRIDLDSFEARYAPGVGQDPPVVQMRGEVILAAGCEDAETIAKQFAVRVPATANSKSAIAAGFDRGVSEFTRQIVDWVSINLNGGQGLKCERLPLAQS